MPLDLDQLEGVVPIRIFNDDCAVSRLMSIACSILGYRRILFRGQTVLAWCFDPVHCRKTGYHRGRHLLKALP